jgi:hypothetical protein
MGAICKVCQIEYNSARRALGYRTCLDCGSTIALREAVRRAKCTAPAYNKGAYQYVGSMSTAREIGR